MLLKRYIDIITVLLTFSQPQITRDASLFRAHVVRMTQHNVIQASYYVFNHVVSPGPSVVANMVLAFSTKERSQPRAGKTMLCRLLLNLALFQIVCHLNLYHTFIITTQLQCKKK